MSMSYVAGGFAVSRRITDADITATAQAGFTGFGLTTSFNSALSGLVNRNLAPPSIAGYMFDPGLWWCDTFS